MFNSLLRGLAVSINDIDQESFVLDALYHDSHLCLSPTGTTGAAKRQRV